MTPELVIDPDADEVTSLRVTAEVINLNLAVESLKVRVDVMLFMFKAVH